jgi:mannose-6-phosphate isomerase-like protein (cupin superfamily)
MAIEQPHHQFSSLSCSTFNLGIDMSSRQQLKFSATEPALVRRSEVPYIVWGDDESGYVNDLIYVRSSQMVFVTITMPPGARFRSSDRFRAYYDTHECLYVLKGQYTCQDPETGEVRTAKTGEMLFMPERRWHYGYNFGTEDLHLLECIVPPTNQAALAHIPRPSTLVGWDKKALIDWPRESVRGVENYRLCRLSDAVDTIIGNENAVLCQVLASTARVFFAVLTISPNSRSDYFTYPFDVCYHGQSGEIQLHAPEGGDYFPITDGDVGFVPSGIPHRLFNHTGSTRRILIGGAGNLARLTVR